MWITLILRRRIEAITQNQLRVKRRSDPLFVDRALAVILLQASGPANALRALLKAEQDRSPYFLRLANALSTLYPKESEKNRLLDAMLLAMPK